MGIGLKLGIRRANKREAYRRAAGVSGVAPTPVQPRRAGAASQIRPMSGAVSGDNATRRKKMNI